MKNSKLIAALCLAISLTAIPLFTACKTPKLEAGGAYTSSITNTVGTNLVVTSQSDLGLYAADASFDLAYTTINSVFLIERNNRMYFWQLSPQIKHTVDKIRPIAQQIVNDYAAARTAYLEHPTPAGLSGIQAILAKLQQLVFAATAAVGQQTNPPTNSVPVTPEAPDTTK